MATVDERRPRQSVADSMTQALEESGYPSESRHKRQCTGSWSFDFDPDNDAYGKFRMNVIAGPLRQIGSELDDMATSKAQNRRVSNVVFDKSYDSVKSIWDQLTDRVEPEPVDKIHVGTITYVLRSALLGHVACDDEHHWNYRVDRFPPHFIGNGPTIADARRDWRTQVHTRFQQLVRSRPFRMSEEEKADWAILSKLIDLELYRKKIPIKQQETGWISKQESGVYEITWLGSEAVEMLNLENASPEFAGFAIGQWFEALVERNREDYSLSKVIHAQPIEPIKEMTDEEWKDWLSSLPTTESLPASDTDWSTF